MLTDMITETSCVRACVRVCTHLHVFVRLLTITSCVHKGCVCGCVPTVLAARTQIAYMWFFILLW